MCSECHRNPCHPSCPNADEPPVVGSCEICDTDIFEGDDIYKLFDAMVCEDCVIQAKTTAVLNERYY